MKPRVITDQSQISDFGTIKADGFTASIICSACYREESGWGETESQAADALSDNLEEWVVVSGRHTATLMTITRIYCPDCNDEREWAAEFADLAEQQ